ncbi:copper transporter [Actinoallomurus soli]|uniref:copper transporter n=1 Tax=Actinoallomurus soli TaxID=2952535 RepID=UPI00209334BF|nr:copper transporter [Actinoallomurus soli]MCO5973646.1 copper transporter [Actinoallomurus soli]
MIDFRYHLVSIIAVFLSLALGLVVGASALRGPLVDQLKETSNRLKNNNETLRRQKDAVGQVNTYNNQVLDAAAGQVVSGRLKDESVVFVEAPGADDQMRAQTADMVSKAGARISGYVTLQSKYLDPNQQATLSELTDRLKPAGLTFSADATSSERTASELAWVLVTKQAARSGQEDPAAGQVLSGFKASGFLTYSGQPATRATLAVVIAPAAASSDKNADDENKALGALPLALYTYGEGAVVAGDPDSATEGGMIKALRDDDDVKGHVATVDTADVPAGRLTAVLALAAAKQGKAGAYGIGSKVDGALPTPIPTPTPTTTKKK